jgi:NADH-quinone oxidoreductase subunit L
LIWLVPALPLAAAVINALIGRRLPKAVVGTLAVGSVGLAFLVSVGLFVDLIARDPEHREVVQTLYSWIATGDLHVSVSFLLDPLSMVMILVVTGVGFLIHFYSLGYMGHDPGFGRFFVYLNLFTFSMLLLVLADNFLLMFVGWELVGLCSYLLIGFWFERPSAAIAGKKAFVTNRVGDYGFLLGLFLLFTVFGTFDFKEIFERAPSVLQGQLGLATLLTLLLFVGATGKSAQVPLYVWLPDAMEGPTPVSALIHAATMVTAGVYMVVRAHVLYEMAPPTLAVVAVVGALTAIYAASMGLTQFDIKRVLAYSTISQLGYMFLAAGVGAFAASIFHLMTHAFFKALLFLGAGSVIHALHNEQDIRRMGGLRHKLPITFATFTVAWLAISGVPFLSGFYSKDAILEHTFARSPVLWAIGLLTAAMTAFYMSRLVFLVFFGSPRYQEMAAAGTSSAAAGGHGHGQGHGTHGEAAHDGTHGHGSAEVHESPWVMTLPLIGLAILSVVGGWMGEAAFTAFLGHAVEPISGVHGKALPDALTVFANPLTWISVAAGLAGIGLAYLMYIQGTPSPQAVAAAFNGLYHLVFNKYYIDELYAAITVGLGGTIARGLALFDVAVVDGVVNGIGNLIRAFGGALRGWQSGYVRAYAATFLVGAVLVVAYWWLRAG